jgi:hypothetical protein
VTKKNQALPAILFLFFSSLIFAQSNESGPRQFTLNWKSDEYAWNYEVTVEKLEAGKYTEILREKTENTEILCPLIVGRYRYQVTAYDFFGSPGGISEWSYFQIIPGQTEILIEEPAPAQPDIPAEEPKPPVEEPETPAGEQNPPLESPPKEPGDFFAQAAYSPLYSLPNTDFNRLYEGFLPVGVSARLGFIPYKGRVISLGFELAPSWSYLASKEDNYSVYAQLINIHVGLVGELWLPNGSMAFNFRLGGGLSLLQNFHFTYSGQQNHDQITTWIPSMHGGISFLWFIYKPIFVEIGAEIVHIFSVDNTFLEFVRPSLGVGLRF